jgi:hypothetical protein
VYNVEDQQWQTVIFPADKPSAPRDIELLWAWYEEALKRWLGKSSAAHNPSDSTLFKELMTVHAICHHELSRQVHIFCEKVLPCGTVACHGSSIVTPCQHCPSGAASEAARRDLPESNPSRRPAR